MMINRYEEMLWSKYDEREKKVNKQTNTQMNEFLRVYMLRNFTYLEIESL